MKSFAKVTAIILILISFAFTACGGGGGGSGADAGGKTSDTTAPMPGLDINYSNISSTSVTVNWGAATDNSTVQSGLSYKLLKTTYDQALSLGLYYYTSAQFDAITDPDILVMNWTANTLSYNVSGLSTNYEYYFIVLVKDGAGNMNMYPYNSVTTLSDYTAPVTGTDITFADVTEASVTVNWGEATDNSTALSGLSYKLVKSTSLTAIDTVEEANAVTGSDLAMDWSVNTLTCAVGSLAHGTTYYFAVLVKDGTENMAIYSPKSISTTVDALWAKSVSAGLGGSVFNSITRDSSGNIYAAGYITGTGLYNFGNAITATGTYSGNNIILVKYNSSGTAQWAKTVAAGSGSSAFNSVALDSSGNVYAVGYIYSNGTYNFGTVPTPVTPPTSGQIAAYNIIFVKYNSSGTAQWAKTITSGTSDSVFNSIAVDNTNSCIYAAGYMSSNGAFNFGNSQTATGTAGSGYRNIILVQYNLSGTAQWAKTVSTGTKTSYFNSICLDSSGNVYAAGYIYGTGESYNFGNSKTAAGTNSFDNVVLVKYNSSGTAQWAQTVSTGSNISSFNSVCSDGYGNIYAAGVIYGTGIYTFGSQTAAGTGSANITLVKYNSSGTAQWAKTVTSGTSLSDFYSVNTDNSGNVYAAGFIYGNGSYNFGNNITASGSYSGIKNMIVVKYNSSGDAQYAKAPICPNDAPLYSVIVDSSGNIYAAGCIYGTGTYDFGNSITAAGTNSSGFNIILVKWN